MDIVYGAMLPVFDKSILVLVQVLLSKQLQLSDYQHYNNKYLPRGSTPPNYNTFILLVIDQTAYCCQHVDFNRWLVYCKECTLVQCFVF